MAIRVGISTFNSTFQHTRQMTTGNSRFPVSRRKGITAVLAVIGAAGYWFISSGKPEPFGKVVDAKDILPPDSRVGSVDKLNRIGNVALTTLEKEPLLKKGKLGYSLRQHPFNPFYATLKEGQIRWVSSKPVNGNQVAEVVEFSKMHGRKLHINTGTHGNKKGDTVVQNIDYGEAKFSKEDLKTAWDLPNVSVHIVSTSAPPIYPPRIDVADAWCYSDASQMGRDISSVAQGFTELFSLLATVGTQNISHHGDTSVSIKSAGNDNTNTAISNVYGNINIDNSKKKE